MYFVNRNMKTFHFRFLSAILLVLQCSGSNGATAHTQLSALKPDLEILRGYWLKNPGEKGREGRIIFLPSNTQILVDYETSTNPIHDEAWATDFLRLQNIFELKLHYVNTPVDELFYKHSTFYIRRNPYALPEALENEDHWIEMLPIDDTENDAKSSVEIRYTDLNTLATYIKNEVSRIDSESEKTSSVYLKIDENEFMFDYVKGRTQLFVRHVRFIQDNIDGNTEQTFSKEEAFLRYDRSTETFFITSGDSLPRGTMVRCSVGYVLRDVPLNQE